MVTDNSGEGPPLFPATGRGEERLGRGGGSVELEAGGDRPGTPGVERDGERCLCAVVTWGGVLGSGSLGSSRYLTRGEHHGERRSGEQGVWPPSPSLLRLVLLPPRALGESCLPSRPQQHPSLGQHRPAAGAREFGAGGGHIFWRLQTPR